MSYVVPRDGNGFGELWYNSHCECFGGSIFSKFAYCVSGVYLFSIIGRF